MYVGVAAVWGASGGATPSVDVVAGDCVLTVEEIASEPKEIRRETMSEC